MPQSDSHRQRRQIPWYRKLLYSCVVTLGFFVTLEIVLAALGVTPITDSRDPFVGFSSQVPLLQERRGSGGQAVMVTAPNKLVWFNRQSFPKAKPEGTRRVFCVGGSTTYGRPYSDLTSYVGWMREFLPLADDSCRWEIVNAGGVSYASYRVAAVMQELAEYEPDLFVVYSAHNEFLEHRTYAGFMEQPAVSLSLQATLSRTRTFTLVNRLLHGAGQGKPAVEKDAVEKGAQRDMLSAEVDERLNHTIGPSDYERDPVWQAKVLKHYEWNLERMVRIARQANADIVFIAPASNARDCAPFKSEPAGASDRAQTMRLASLLEQAKKALSLEAYRPALELLAQAQTVAPRHAEASYLYGKTLVHLGREGEACQAFRRARNEDVCPLRAVDGIFAAVRRVAATHRAPLVDFEARLSDQCQQELGHRCLGDEYFLDHVHPTIDVHRQLALWIIQRLQQAALVGGRDLADPEMDQKVQRVVERVAGQIDKPAHGIALRNLAKVLHWSGKFAEAAPRASDALELLPNDPESRLVLADCLKNLGDIDGSLAQYELLFEDHEDYGRAFLPYGELLVEHEQWTRGKVYLLLALLREPQNAHAHYVLGKAHFLLGEYEFAVEALTEANRLHPDDPGILELLAASVQANQDASSIAQ